MSAGIYNLEILQGETFEKRITWKDKSGNVVDLSGYSAKMQIRNSKSQTALLIIKLIFVNALSDITPHSLYATVPLVTLVGYLYDNNGNKVNKTITINRWLILDITTPNNP